jgi:type IV secretion system protein VirD4
MVSRQETARQLITPGEIMQLPSNEELILLSGFSPIKAKKVRYYADKNFTGRVLSPPMTSPNSNGDLPPSSSCVWGNRTRLVDDRLYSKAGKSEQDKIAASLNDDDEGGKDINPDLDAPEVSSESRDKADENKRDVAVGDELASALKLGEFVRGPSELARAHNFSQNNETQIGM